MRVKVAPIDLRLSFLFQNVGTLDPTAQVSDSHLRKAFHARTGPCTVALRRCEGGLEPLRGHRFRAIRLLHTAASK